MIDFGDSSSDSGHLSAEVDDRDDGLNDGETSFSPGDTAYFLVFASDNVSYNTPVVSAGKIKEATLTGGTVEREEDLSFANTNEASLGVPAESITSLIWLGRSLGTLTLGDDKQTVTASASGVAVARVTYTAPAKAYGLVSPASVNGETDYTALIYIKGTLNS